MMSLHSSFRDALVVALGVALAFVVTASPAPALEYDVTQGGVLLGTITPFSSAETGADFYQFGIPHTYSGGPSGVPLSSDSSILYVHLDTNTGLYSLGWIHGEEGAGPLRYLQGIVQVTDDVASPAVLVSDDPGSLRPYDEDHLAAYLDELAADPSTARTFIGNWRWGPNRTDGGVVGPIGTTLDVGGATATITSLALAAQNLGWFAASADGSLVPLSLEEGSPVKLTATPELPPFALAGLGLPLSWIWNRLRRRRG